LGTLKSDSTIDAIIVASAQTAHATDILTSDPENMKPFAGNDIYIHKI
jgi:hypothetical protein